MFVFLPIPGDALMFVFAVPAQNAGVTLPFDLVESLDGVKFKIRVPSSWNGTLLLYLQASKSTAPPPEPLVAPPTIDSPHPTLEATLLAQGYALAASEISAANWQLKEEVQDTFALAAFFRAGATLRGGASPSGSPAIIASTRSANRWAAS